MNSKDLRKQFPHLEKGVTYLNHAASGPVSKPVLDVMNDFFREKSQRNIDDYPSFVKVTEETKEMLAYYINTEKERIAFADNTTSGLNLLAQGLKWEPGDEIILNDIEFPANVYPFLNLEKKGVNIQFVESHEGIVSAEDIIEKISPKTRLISVSMVQFLSGYRIDLQKLGKACRSRDVILCVDGIQGLGALRLDVKEWNIDFLSCGTQKWMLGLQGLSFIYISKALQDKIDPVYVGWLGVNDGWNLLDYNLSLKDSAERFQPGSLNSVGIFALNASLKLFRDYGIKEVENNVLLNTKLLRTELKKLGLTAYPSEIDEKFYSGIVSFRHKEAYSVLEVLKERKVEIAVREGIVRISPHFYNNESDIGRLTEGLKLLF
jgi:cysteine desulfurase / selenocysteine lyase